MRDAPFERALEARRQQAAVEENKKRKMEEEDIQRRVKQELKGKGSGKAGEGKGEGKGGDVTGGEAKSNLPSLEQFLRERNGNETGPGKERDACAEARKMRRASCTTCGKLVAGDLWLVTCGW